MYRSTRNGTDADDIVQDAFVRLLRADVGALSDGELRRYVFRIAGNLMTDRWRRSDRELSWLARLRGEPRAEPDAVDAPGSVPEFDALNRRDRALLWLAYVEEHDRAEIARALGLARGSVKVLLSRARAKLRTLLLKRDLKGASKRSGSGAASEAERQIGDYMSRLADAPIAVAPRLPNAEAIWVRAELLRRWEARNAALAPLNTMERVQIAAGLAAAVVLLVRSFPSLLYVVGRG